MIPVQTFLAYCTWFTFGVALLSTTIPMLIPFGVAFALLGIAPFFSERVALRFTACFLLLLGVSLLYVVQSLRLGDGLPSSMPKPSIWYVGALIVGWGVGILFGFRRWRSSRPNVKHDV